MSQRYTPSVLWQNCVVNSRKSSVSQCVRSAGPTSTCRRCVIQPICFVAFRFHCQRCFFFFFSFLLKQFLVWNLSSNSQTWQRSSCRRASGHLELLRDVNKRSCSDGRGAGGSQRLYFIAAFEPLHVFPPLFLSDAVCQTVNLPVWQFYHGLHHTSGYCAVGECSVRVWFESKG